MRKRDWKAKELEEFEAGLVQKFREGKFNCPCHFSGGNETQLVTIFETIKDEDWVFSTHRSHYHFLLKGGDSQALIDELQGLPCGVCKGAGRSMHLFDTSINFYTSAIIGGTCAIAAGVALGLKKTESTAHVYCFVGDGAEDSGWFTEAVRFSHARGLPVTFIIEDNNLAVETTKLKRWKANAETSAPNVLRYNYVRKYPHVGIGKRVSF